MSPQIEKLWDGCSGEQEHELRDGCSGEREGWAEVVQVQAWATYSNAIVKKFNMYVRTSTWCAVV